MWRHRKAQLAGEDPRDRADAEHNTKDHKQTAVRDANVINSTSICDTATTALLSSKPVRGRGGVGSRVEETGPYMPAEANTARETSGSPRGHISLGPQCPDWIRQASHQIDDPLPTSQHHLGTCSRSQSRGASLRASEVRKISKMKSSENKDKKAKKKHKKKHKHRHKDVH